MRLPPDYRKAPIVGNEHDQLVPRVSTPKLKGGHVTGLLRSFVRSAKGAGRQTAAGRRGQQRWQRVVIRCRSEKVNTSWRELGRYLERPGANPDGCCFDRASNQVSGETTLDSWQNTADSHERITKLVLSPENAAAMDLKRFTREFMAQLEREHGRSYSWAAAVHTDTDHPHVHVAIRGVDSLGDRVWFDNQCLFERMIPTARRLATNQAGYVANEAERQPSSQISRFNNQRRIHESSVRR